MTIYYDLYFDDKDVSGLMSKYPNGLSESDYKDLTGRPSVPRDFNSLWQKTEFDRTSFLRISGNYLGEGFLDSFARAEGVSFNCDCFGECDYEVCRGRHYHNAEVVST
jgi:hypothetical protein